MSFTTQAEVVSELKSIKKVIFKGSLLYIIWDDNTASEYQYNYMGNVNISKLIQEKDEVQE